MPRNHRYLLAVHTFALIPSDPGLTEQLLQCAQLRGFRQTSPAKADLVLMPLGGRPGPLRPTSRTLLSAARRIGRLYAFSQADVPWVPLPGVFASAPCGGPGSRHAVGGFYLPTYPPHQIDEFDPDGRQPTLLWSFWGTPRTSPRLRSAVLAIADERADTRDTSHFAETLRWRSADDAERVLAEKRYAATIRTSAFVVCPRGFGTNSVRIFEAMQAGRCPVIISDDLREPYGTDWASCSIRVAEADVEHLPRILRAQEHRAASLGRAARGAWETRYAPEVALQTILEACAELRATASGRARTRLLFQPSTAREASYRLKRRARNAIVR